MSSFYFHSYNLRNKLEVITQIENSFASNIVEKWLLTTKINNQFMERYPFIDIKRNKHKVVNKNVCVMKGMCSNYCPYDMTDRF